MRKTNVIILISDVIDFKTEGVTKNKGILHNYKNLNISGTYMKCKYVCY